MRRFTLAAAALALLFALDLRSWAGNEALDIVQKAIKAHEVVKDSKTTGYHGRNKGTIHIQGLMLEFTQDVYVQAPGKFKEVMEMTVNNTPVKVSTVFNGKEGWIKANDTDIEVKDEILAEFKEISYWMRLGDLTGFMDKDLKLSIIGEAKVNGKAAIGIKVSKEGKKDIDFYFDKDTGMLAKTERAAPRDFQTGQEVTEERIVNAYQKLAGRKMPKTVTVLRDGNKLLEAEVIEGRFVEKFDDSEFAKP